MRVKVMSFMAAQEEVFQMLIILSEMAAQEEVFQMLIILSETFDFDSVLDSIYARPCSY